MARDNNNFDNDDSQDYKIFKSVRIIKPEESNIWQDADLETLINHWSDNGYVVDKLTSNTTAFNDSLVMETTVLMRYNDPDDDYDYDEFDDEEEDDEDDDEDEFDEDDDEEDKDEVDN